MTFTIPESAFEPFYDTPCCFTGNRPNGNVVSAVVRCCLFEEGEYPETPADGVAPSRERSWTARVPMSKWPELLRPQVGDEVSFRPDKRIDADINCRVSAVTEAHGDYILVFQERKPQP